MKILFYLSVSFTVVILLNTVVYAQDNAKRERFIQKLSETFSKRQFIKGLETINQSTIITVKRVKANSELSTDSLLIKKYEVARSAYNKVIEKMVKEINEVNNIIDYGTFNPQNRYSSDLDAAQKLIDDFKNAAEVKITKGEQASAIGEFISKLLSTLFPAFKIAEQTFLSVAKEIMSTKLEKELLPKWDDIKPI